jgi:hypothetical protein
MPREMGTEMRQEPTLLQEVREAVAWVTFALTYTFLPEHLSGTLHFRPSIGGCLWSVDGRRTVGCD